MIHEKKRISLDGKSHAHGNGSLFGRHAFSKASRLLKRSEFLRLSRKNRKVSNRHFLALFDHGINEQSRLGITVTKRVGNAVVRNQLKRYVREYFRKHHLSVKNAKDINIIVKKEASAISSKEAYSSLHSIFSRIRD